MTPSGAAPDSAPRAAHSALDAAQEAKAPSSPDPVPDCSVTVDVATVTPDEPASTPGATALLCVSAGLGLAVLTMWVIRHGGAVPAFDETVHRWVVEHRTSGSLTIARAVTWGGVTSLVLPALVVVGAVATRGGRDYLRRLQMGLVVTVLASVGVFVGLRINACWDAVGLRRPIGRGPRAALRFHLAPRAAPRWWRWRRRGTSPSVSGSGGRGSWSGSEPGCGRSASG